MLKSLSRAAVIFRLEFRIIKEKGYSNRNKDINPRDGIIVTILPVRNLIFISKII